MKRETRWRLVLGSAAQAHLPLPDDQAAAEQALSWLERAGQSSPLQDSAPRGDAPSPTAWLRQARQALSPAAANLLARAALRSAHQATMLADPAWMREVDADPVLLEAVLAPLRKAGAALDPALEAAAEDLAARTLHQLAQDLGPLARPRRRGRLDARRTIQANLHRWDGRRLIIDRPRFVQRGAARERHVVFLIDRSASMTGQLVGTVATAAALRAQPALEVQLAIFADTVTDLSDLLGDPIALLRSLPPAGGTDIRGALAWAAGQLGAPGASAVLLRSDLREGGALGALTAAAQALVGSGAMLLVLPAAEHDRQAAAALRAAGAQVEALDAPALIARLLAGDRDA